MKKRVQHVILEDMKKYLPDLDFSRYVESSVTDNTVVAMLEDWYDRCLPVDISAWARVNTPKDDTRYKKYFLSQISFVRDVILRLFSSSFEEYANNLVMVVGTYESKSIKLPVYQIKIEKYGLDIVLKDNFYNWKVSICSETPLEFDMMGLVEPDRIIDLYDCEGFPGNKIYGSYNQNHSKFTIEIVSEYNLYVFFFILKNYLEQKN